MNKILLIGESCTDTFIYGDCSRLNPEAPTPLINELYRNTFPGMAANVRENLKVLGFEVDFLTQDEPITKTRYVDDKSNYILLRVDNDNHPRCIKGIREFDVAQYDLVIISDYDKGFLYTSDITSILKRSKLSFIDTKKPIGSWIKEATFIKINQKEYDNIENDFNFIAPLTDKFIVTLGERGATLDGTLYKVPRKVIARDVVGAGDTFLSAVAGHYYLHNNIDDAINFANLCASQVVSKRGIAYPNEKLC